MLLLLEEIAIEILMIVAVVVAVGSLARLLQLSVRERVYLRRFRRQLVSQSHPLARPPQTARPRRDAAEALRERHV